MARKVKKGKRLQEVPEQNLAAVHTPVGGPKDTPKPSSRKKKAAKDVAAPTTACAAAAVEPQERRRGRQRNAEEIPQASPLSLRRTRRTKERKMHPQTPPAGVQINFYLSPEQTFRALGAVAGIQVTGFPASSEPALGTPVPGEAILPVHTGQNTVERERTQLSSPDRRDQSIGKAVNNLVRGRVVRNPTVKVDLSKRISNPSGRLLRSAVRDGSISRVLPLETETPAGRNQADPDAAGTCPLRACDGMTQATPTEAPKPELEGSAAHTVDPKESIPQ